MPSGAPNSTPSVAIVFSLAKKLESSATTIRQSFRPINRPTGSSALPTVARMLVSTLPPGRFESAQTTAEDSRMKVPAFLRKDVVLFQT